MKKPRSVNLHADDLPFEDELPGLLAQITLGENIERGLTDATSPLAHMVAKARDEFIAATLSLIDSDEVDLSTPEGVVQARSLQAKAHRYLTICRWLSEANIAAAEAEEQLDQVDQEERAAIEDLKDDLYGKRAKPAPDA